MKLKLKVPKALRRDPISKCMSHSHSLILWSYTCTLSSCILLSYETKAVSYDPSTNLLNDISDFDSRSRRSSKGSDPPKNSRKTSIGSRNTKPGNPKTSKSSKSSMRWWWGWWWWRWKWCARLKWGWWWAGPGLEVPLRCWRPSSPNWS